MGTTVVAAVIDSRGLSIAHVGDSRIYLYREGKLQRLTEDHSLVMDQVKHGLITPEEAERSHLQNILTRALGTQELVEVDVQDRPVSPGDVYLLCTDGLTKMVSEAEISEVLAGRARPRAAVGELIGRAREAGGPDNITAVVARVGGAGQVRNFISRLFKKI
jgi:protein phosphatase